MYWINIGNSNEFYTSKIAILHVFHKSELWFWSFSIFNKADGHHLVFWKSQRLNGKIDIINVFYTPKIAMLHVLHKSELWFWIFQFSTWPTAAILFWKTLRLNGKIDITNEFYTLKIVMLHVLHKSELWYWIFQIFKMADHRHLDFWKRLHGYN